MLEQSMNHISLSKNRQAYRCNAKSPTAQNALWTIPGLISCTEMGLLPHAQNDVRWLALCI